VLGLQAKLYAIGAGLLAFFAMIVRMQSLKNARDKARLEADSLKARAHVVKVKRKIKRKEQIRLSEEKAHVKGQLSKEGEDFKGTDNFSKPNDF